MDDLMSRQVLDLWNRYKPTIAVDAIEYDRELKQLLSTNLAEVGTDAISRQSAIDALEQGFKDATDGLDKLSPTRGLIEAVTGIYKCYIKQLPPIQPEIVRCKDCRYGILDSGFPHQYFCKFKGNEWNNENYFCGHAKKREVTI